MEYVGFSPNFAKLSIGSSLHQAVSNPRHSHQKFRFAGVNYNFFPQTADVDVDDMFIHHANVYTPDSFRFLADDNETPLQHTFIALAIPELL